MCWSDAKRRRLPNLWTLGGLAVGLALQAGFYGTAGLTDGACAAGIAVLVLLIPFLLGAVGAGDLKMLAACGAFVGVRLMPLYLMAMSLSGLLVLVGQVIVQPVPRARMKHLLRCVFDWRYDRRAGRAALPAKEDERGRVPYGIAIALGLWITLAAEFYLGVRA